MTDHAAEARTILASFDPTARPAEAAMAHATLALADEQRTANLVALYALTGPEFDIEDLDYSALRADITARLGLTPTTPASDS